LTILLFGTKYPHVAEPLTMLVIGAALYGFFVVLEGMWIGLARTAIDSVASGGGMLATIVLGVALIPRAGLSGAAAAYAAGSAVQLIVIAAFTGWALLRGTAMRRQTIDALEPAVVGPEPDASS
jgi:O-antigen/teichoic acid export membrane protein